MRPRILIVSLENWHSIARLPRTLQQAGFEVAAMCHRESFLASTKYLDQSYWLDSRRFGLRISRQIISVIRQWRPQMIVPGDDRCVLFFRGMIQLHMTGKHELAPDVLGVLQGSFGNFDWQGEATSKLGTLERACRLGRSTPRFASVHSVGEAITQAKDLGWPVVMKKSTGWGGSGVTFCDNEDQVATVYRKYSEVTRWKGMLKARLIQARGWALGPDWFPTDPSVTVNEAVYGKPAMIAVSAVNGKVLSHATAIKELCYPQVTSPSSVVRFVEHQDMKKTVVDLVAHWGATGFLGFDFMLSADGSTRLIECNARPTFLSYMGALSGSDLCLALHHYLVGIEIPTPSVPQQELAAHFPNEWRRDPKSPHLLSAYHDVPWDDPGLLAKLIKEWK